MCPMQFMRNKQDPKWSFYFPESRVRVLTLPWPRAEIISGDASHGSLFLWGPKESGLKKNGAFILHLPSWWKLCLWLILLKLDFDQVTSFLINFPKTRNKVMMPSALRQTSHWLYPSQLVFLLEGERDIAWKSRGLKWDGRSCHLKTTSGVDHGLVFIFSLLVKF